MKKICLFIMIIFATFLIGGCNSTVQIEEKANQPIVWETYSNQEYNIKIDYLSDWQKTEKLTGLTDDMDFYLNLKKDPVMFTIVRMPLEPRSVLGTLDEISERAVSDLSVFDGFSLIESKRIKLDEYDAQRIVYTNKNDQFYFKYLMIILIKDGDIYNIKFKARGNTDIVDSYDKYIDVVEKMLNSLDI